jgi:lipoprotein
MKKIGLVFLSLILTVVALVACKPATKLSIEDRLVGEYTSDLGTWEFDEDGDVYFSGLKGSWTIDDESSDDESSESESPQKISISFSNYSKDKGLVFIQFTSEIESDGEKAYEKLSKLNLNFNLEESHFDDFKSMEEKFEGIKVIRLTRKQ